MNKGRSILSGLVYRGHVSSEVQPQAELHDARASGGRELPVIGPAHTVLKATEIRMVERVLHLDLDLSIDELRDV